MRKYTPLICKDCPTEIFVDVNMVMLKDELWAKICDDHKDALCDCCIEKRLGRKITPNRTTLKYPLNYPTEQKTFIEKQIPTIISEVKATQAWRGRFDKTGITLCNDSKKEKLRFDFK